MDKKIILELIRKDLDELSLLVQALEGYSGKEKILIELATSKANSLIQEIALLDVDYTIEDMDKGPAQLVEKAKPHSEPKLITVVETAEKEAKEPLPSENEVPEYNNPDTFQSESVKQEDHQATELKAEVKTPVDEETVVVTKDEPKPVIKEEEVVNTKATIHEENINVEERQEEQAKPFEEIEEETKKVESAVPEKVILGEKFKQEPNLNERLALAREQPSKLFAQPITSIRKAIGINDRFMYIRELFANDTDRFNKTVDILDKAENLMQAVEYLEEKCQWQKSDISLKFMELVKRRFSNYN